MAKRKRIDFHMMVGGHEVAFRVAEGEPVKAARKRLQAQLDTLPVPKLGTEIRVRGLYRPVFL